MLPLGTHGLSDAEFVAAMDGLTLSKNDFRHYDHIRLAWIFLRESHGTGGPNIDTATDRMTRAIQRFAAHHGAVGKYHDTMTRAYMRFVAAHARMTPQLDDFAEFAAAHPELFDRALPLVYYSESRLMSSDARAGWVEPDLKPLPHY
jgi:hypothetical protein